MSSLHRTSHVVLFALAVACSLAGAAEAAPAAPSPSQALTIQPGANTLVSGLGGLEGYGETDLTTAGTLQGTLDDGFWPVDLSAVFPNGISYFGVKYDAAAAVFASTNGHVTFGQGSGVGMSQGLAHSLLPVVAGAYADLDFTAGDGKVYLDLDTTAGDPVATLTYLRAPRFPADLSVRDSFQIRLHRTSSDPIGGDGMAIELRYSQLEWVTAPSSMSGLYATGGWADGSTAGASIFSCATPTACAAGHTVADVGDTSPVTLGMRFTANQDGRVAGVRYYGDGAMTGTRQGGLFAGSSAPGTLLKQTAVVPVKAAAGWTTLLFDAPVSVTASTQYTIALWASPASKVTVAFRNFFDTAVDRPPLNLPAAAGKYSYAGGNSLALPDQQYLNSAYMLDVVFESGTPTPVHGEVTYAGTSQMGLNATPDAAATNLGVPGVYAWVPLTAAVHGAGSGQSTAVTLPFTQPLEVKVTDAAGSPVAGATVSFAAPGLGASAVLSAAQATTNGAGLASVTATANGTTGSYAVTAFASGIGYSAPAFFTLTNVPPYTFIAGVSPASLAFGDQLLATTSAAQSVTLSNTGTGPLSITSIGLSGANGGDFGKVTTCGATVSSGASCVISVTFAPTASGARAASLAIATNDPVNPSLTVGLAGTGVVPAATGVTLTPSLASPQVLGTAVAFTAEGQGSSGYQYRFDFYNGSTWSTVQDYSSTNAWTMPASTPVGDYWVAVLVRTNPSGAHNAIGYARFGVVPVPLPP